MYYSLCAAKLGLGRMDPGKKNKRKGNHNTFRAKWVGGPNYRLGRVEKSVSETEKVSLGPISFQPP